MTGLPLGDLCFLSISNNFRVGDDAENVRRAIQSGVHAPAHAPTLPPPCVVTVDEGSASAALAPARREAPILVAMVPRVSEREVGAPSEILAATPVLADRLLRYRGTIDQIDTLITRLRTEVARDGREHSNSLLLSPRDPVSDRIVEATPLICLQLRRQLGQLHVAAILQRCGCRSNDSRAAQSPPCHRHRGIGSHRKRHLRPRRPISVAARDPESHGAHVMSRGMSRVRSRGVG